MSDASRRERIPADAPECVTPTRVEPAPWCHRRATLRSRHAL